MSKRFKLVFFIRFFGYAIFFAGLVSLVAVFGPVIQTEVSYRTDKLLGIRRSVPKIITSAAGDTSSSDFGNIQTGAQIITPVSTEFGVVIEKINANAKIVESVDPGSEREYVAALTQGVAHAAGTNMPGEVGNMYLFSHSTDAPWNIVRFNAIFYLLRELETGDKVIIFYKDRRYDYIVFDKVIADPTDIQYLTNKYEEPVLTLQTCDPPGTLLHRLIVRARLEGS